jgi:hypothetical protein
MPFKLRFRKSISIVPGVKVNLSKSGVGASVGTKGARLSTGPRGTRASVGAGPVRYEKQVSAAPRRRRWWLLWLA